MRGIVAAATATGKTRMAHAAIHRFWSARARVVIVVPSVTLQQQWVQGLCSTFGLADTQIGLLGGGATSVREGHGFVVAVINSARNGLRSLNAGWRDESRATMLVVDECHWAATTRNAEIFDGLYDATLGLSATPERSDDGLHEILVPRLGHVVYHFGVKAALDGGLLAPLTVVNLYFDLGRQEMELLRPINESVKRIEEFLAERFPDTDELRGLERSSALLRLSKDLTESRSLGDLYQRRSQILEGSDSRRSVVRELAQSGLFQVRPTMVFHERLDAAKRTARLLQELGCRVSLELSTDDRRRREAEIQSFRQGRSDVLVAVRTLDEGVDLPDAKQALIVSGSQSLRQRLQRIGRVLRPTEEPAFVLTLLARRTSEQFVIGDNDPFLLGPDRVLTASSTDVALAQLEAVGWTGVTRR